MAKVTLPTMKAYEKPQPPRGVATATTQPKEPVFLTPAVDPDAEEDAVRDASVELGEDEAIKGMTAEVVTSAKQLAEIEATRAQASRPVEAAPPSLTPRLAADDIARLEELSRTILEVRGLAVAAQTTITNYRAEIDHLVSTLKLHFDVLVKDEWKLVRDQLADEHAHACGLDDEVAMLRSRLDAADKLLADRGLPTTASQAKPTLKLHARRRLVHPAKLDGDAVVIYYNPRQGGEGSDNQEFTLSKDNVRNVWTGYLVEVPSGYVCDVFVGADVVFALVGKGDGEYIAKIWTRGANRTVSAGQEVCRLSLRRVEPMRLEVIRE